MAPSLLLPRLVLAVLAAYHLGIGLASVTSLGATRRLAGLLYGLAFRDDPALRYAVRMLGLYALTIGGLLVVAAVDPSGHRDVIIAVATLQCARAVHRLVFRGELTDGFGVRRGRNIGNVALLLAEAGILLAWLPPSA